MERIHALPGQVPFYPSGKGGKRVIDPSPEIGIPDEKLGIWDARVAARLLVSEKRHLGNELAKHKTESLVAHMEMQRKIDPNYEPFNDPQVPGPEMGIRVWSEGSTWKSKFTGLPSQGMGSGDGGASIHENNFQKPHFPNFQHIPRTVDEFYELQMPQERVEPNFPQLRGPRQNARYLAMLNHALYQLNAPTTPWMVVHLGANIATGLLPHEHAPTLGHGQFRVEPFGISKTLEPGWAFLNPVRQGPPIPFVPYERRNTRRLRNAEPEPEIVWGENIIALDLDERFGEPGHQPLVQPYQKDEGTIHYGVYVARSNQSRVLGSETWGLDFYTG
jgi:hypothetical protein